MNKEDVPFTLARADERSAHVIEDGHVVGTIIFDEGRGEWIADTGGQSRSCPTFDNAVWFIAAVREPETTVSILRSPGL